MVTGQRRSASRSQHAQILNDMLGEYRDVVGEEEVGGGRDEDSTSIGGRMLLLLVLLVPLRALLTIGRMDG